MFLKRFASRYSALVTAAVLFVPPAIAVVPPGVCTLSTPCTCNTPSFTVTLVDKTVTPGTATTQTTTRYTYRAIGTPSKINGVLNGQFVIPRPVVNVVDPTSGDILPQGVNGSGVFNTLTYCESDRNTGINKGNCNGFLAYVAPSALTSTSVDFVIASGQRVADGLVTINIVSGQGSSELCKSTDGSGLATGIVGPGDLGDPFQPKFAEQKATVAGGKCTAKLKFDKHGNVFEVEAIPNEGESTTTCVTGSPGVGFNDVPKKTQFPTSEIIIGSGPDAFPLKNNTGPHGITFGTGTTTCYGPSIPSPAKCICTKLPCP